MNPSRLFILRPVATSPVLSTEPDALVVPAQAAQTGQGNSTFVFVVKDDSTVETRRIGGRPGCGRRPGAPAKSSP